ncbi:MAG TPA: EAL domain-containing protein [Solirubrobacteraceae bacterium]|jgi:diguanylate cyclase (GGDEF)-like protein|nr:EAL domain-containing protein [Solirubrobacteraceae bacterium]
MPDSDIPKHDSEHDNAPADAAGAGAPAQNAPEPDPSTATHAVELQGTNANGADGDAQATVAPSTRAVARLKQLVEGRKAVWVAVAVLCVVLGSVGSVLAAHAVARSDAKNAGQAFPRTSTGIARTSSGIVSTLKQAIQREEDLVIGASTFFAGHPKASAAEFATWVKWSQALRRYPELEKLGLVALVRAPELTAFEAQLAGHAAKPARPRAPLSTAGSLRAVPAGTRAYYCFAAVELARSPGQRARAGLDYCALTPGLLSSRDSARSVYTSASARRGRGLSVEVPVYVGNAPSSSLVSRRGAFAGWLREVLAPEVMLRQALLGHPRYAARLRYKAGSSNVAFSSGTALPSAPSRTFDLHNGWTVRTFGPPAATSSMLADTSALALLIAGGVLSVLAGLLIFVLGSGRTRERAPARRKLAQSELYDGLTGLPNRALTLDRAERMVARTGRQSGMLAGALFIDIDWFKQINEKLGQPAGDELLRIFAQRLVGVVRAEDTVGRFAGDKFAVLVESAARGVRLDSLAGRMIDALHKPIELEDFGPRFFSTASIGVAFGRYASAEDLLHDAQVALIAAKTAGKDRYTLFNANMRTIIESRAVLEEELNTALQEKQFFLLYEPIYDLTTRKVVGLEALVRWVHPKQGVLPPGDFIPLAEESGQIVPIGRWVLEEACTRAAGWNVGGHRVGISVKIPANQLNRDGFVTDVRRALQQSGIDPSLLTLEIAEPTVMRDLAATAERLAEVRQLGVRIAIDDFGGSGYARHSDLQQMPLDVLKVDRSSLAASEDVDYRSWLLEAILVFGRDLSLTVIATGIETAEQMATLQAMGCTLAQGSFTGKPTPADAVEALLDAELPSSEEASPASSLEASTASTHE